MKIKVVRFAAHVRATVIATVNVPRVCSAFREMAATLLLLLAVRTKCSVTMITALTQRLM
jgi:hypothetical protein